jgi:Ca2+-binding RTX toxin-like protein
LSLGGQSNAGSNAVTVTGSLTAGFFGIQLQGDSNRLVNHGTITADNTAIVFMASVAATASGRNFIDNTGVITGGTGINLNGDAGEFNFVTNSGTLGSSAPTGIAITSAVTAAVHDTVFNTGEIVGDLRLGNDIYVVDSAGDVVSETGGGIDLVITNQTTDLNTMPQIENLTLSFGAANGTGNGLANVINGNAGANTLSGLGANDTINGFAGNDVLIGGLGADTQNGGVGNDRYDFNDAAESTSFSQDRLLTFDAVGAGAGDLCDVSGLFAGVLTYTAGPGGAGTIWVDNAGGGSTDSIIFANLDADAGAEFQCAVADGAAIDQSAWVAADFVL